MLLGPSAHELMNSICLSRIKVKVLLHARYVARPPIGNRHYQARMACFSSWMVLIEKAWKSLFLLDADPPVFQHSCFEQRATCAWACSGPPDEGTQQKARPRGRSPEEIRGDRQSKAHPAEALMAVDVAVSWFSAA